MEQGIKVSATALTAAGVGMALMYLLDPQAGNRRRASIRDTISRTAHRTEDALTTTARDARNRGRGLLAAVPSFFRSEDVSDRVLTERIRSKLGVLVRHPSSIEVSAENGRVTLSGPVLDDEVDRLLRRVQAVRGVHEVTNRLEVHDQPNNIPGLQGDSPRAPQGSQFELLQENWSPTARVGVGLAGAWLAIYGAARGDVIGAGFSVLGIAAVTRASANLPMRRMLGVGAGRRAVDLNKTITIQAPVERVFEFWSKYEDFPRYTSHVGEVRDLGDGRSRWTIVGPAGVPASWTALITSRIPNQELAWRTEPDSRIRHAGILKFAGRDDGTTTVHIHVTYNPPGGAIGHALARVARTDLKTLLEDDLVRIKTAIETGKPPRDAQQRTPPTAASAR